MNLIVEYCSYAVSLLYIFLPCDTELPGHIISHYLIRTESCTPMSRPKRVDCTLPWPSSVRASRPPETALPEYCRDVPKKSRPMRVRRTKTECSIWTFRVVVHQWAMRLLSVRFSVRRQWFSNYGRWRREGVTLTAKGDSIARHERHE